MRTTGLAVSKLAGYAPAVPTPFGKNGEIDHAALEQLCDMLVRHGAHALVVCGTTGEAPTLTRAEHTEVIGVARSVTRGRIPVIAGAGSNSTEHAIELARRMASPEDRPLHLLGIMSSAVRLLSCLVLSSRQRRPVRRHRHEGRSE
jgi:hypothetical protein